MTPKNSFAQDSDQDLIIPLGEDMRTPGWIETLPFGAAFFDQTKLQVLFSNSQFKKWFGLSEHERTHLPQIFLDQIGESRIRATISEVLAQTVTRTFPIECKAAETGKRIAGLVRISSGAAFRSNAVLFLIDDISEQKKSQVLGESVARLQTENLKRLAESRANMRRVLDHLPQAFLLFNRHGEVTHSYSVLSSRLFPLGANQKNIREVLELTDPKHDAFFSILFEDIDPLLLNEVCPKETQIGDHLVALRFVRLAEDGVENQVLCALEDITEVRALQKDLETKERVRNQILNAVMYRDPFLSMVERIKGLNAFTDDEIHFRRQIHALKANLAFFGFRELASACHGWESLVSEKRSFPLQETQDLARELHAGIQKFLVEQADIIRIDPALEGFHFTIPLQRIRALQEAIDRNAQPNELTSHLENWVALSTQQALSWLNGVWISTLESLGKPAAPIQFGETSAQISPHLYRDLFGLLPLAVRNAADHGIETAARRQDLGKPPEGQLKIQLTEVTHEGRDFYHLEISDDGAGMDWEKIHKRTQPAQESDSNRWSPQRLLRLIATQEVSTRAEVSMVSGRGIGLGTLYEALEKRGGQLQIESTPGVGTTLKMTFPKLTRFGEPQ